MDGDEGCGHGDEKLVSVVVRDSSATLDFGAISGALDVGRIASVGSTQYQTRNCGRTKRSDSTLDRSQMGLGPSKNLVTCGHCHGTRSGRRLHWSFGPSSMDSSQKIRRTSHSLLSTTKECRIQGTFHVSIGATPKFKMV
eukprot:scaffold144874_cov41-Attheya_sp.AAC.1